APTARGFAVGAASAANPMPVGAASAANKPWQNPLQAAHHYATLINTPEARQRAAEAVALCRPPGSFTPVLCHRDPTAPNLVTTPDHRLVLLDWEYAGPDDPYFDLAVLIEHHQLPDRATRILLDSWSPPGEAAEPTQLDRARELYRRVAWLWEEAHRAISPLKHQKAD
ncbi:MAG: phosphotransferase, partial [Chromatiales bacterium]|nr:phosphotransferase [Chromatiales bacterium]